MDMDENELKKIRSEFEKRFSPEELKYTAELVHQLGVLTAIKNLDGVTDFDLIAKELYRIKGILSLEEMKEIVEKQYPKLVAQGLLEEDGSLSLIAEGVVEDYERRLNATNEPSTRMELTDLPFMVPSSKEVKAILKQLGSMWCITPWHRECEKFTPAATATFSGKSSILALKSYFAQGGLAGLQVHGFSKDSDWGRIRDEWVELRNKDIQCFRIDNLIVTVRPASVEEIKVNFGSMKACSVDAYAAYCTWELQNRDRFGLKEEGVLVEEMWKKNPVLFQIEKSYPCFLTCNEVFSSVEKLIEHVREVPHFDESGQRIPRDFIEHSIEMLKEVLK